MFASLCASAIQIGFISFVENSLITWKKKYNNFYDFRKKSVKEMIYQQED